MAFSQGDESGSIVVYWYGEFVESCAPPQKSCLQSQFRLATESKMACCSKNSTNPLVDTDAYVASSDVSLDGYICTHICLIYVFAERLQSHQQFRAVFDVQLVTSATILCPRQGLVDSQASQPFFICCCLYSDKLSFRLCLLLVCSVCWVIRPMFVIPGSSEPNK